MKYISVSQTRKTSAFFLVKWEAAIVQGGLASCSSEQITAGKTSPSSAWRQWEHPHSAGKTWGGMEMGSWARLSWHILRLWSRGSAGAHLAAGGGTAAASPGQT